MKSIKQIFIWLIKIAGLTLLYIPVWIAGAMVIQGQLPEIQSDPGLIDENLGMLFLALMNTLLIISLIITSRWRGWKLAIILAIAYYGSFTFITQIETWYFLSDLTVPVELLPGLFLMGLTVPLIFIPAAIFVCGYWKNGSAKKVPASVSIPLNQFLLKLMAISVIYVIIYWLAGYFIAWQNPDLRAFYGSPGEITQFWVHTFQTLSESPDLFILQLIRGAIFALFVYPVIRGSAVNPWITAIIIGSLLAVPHLGHILSNPLMPDAGIRFSHMIETASSTFLFGMVIVWLFHRKHTGLKDLF